MSNTATALRAPLSHAESRRPAHVQALARPAALVRATSLAFLRFESPDLQVNERFMLDFGMVPASRSAEQLVMRGASERLAPILMTSLCTALALLPLVIPGSIPGHEIEHPMAVVILGGLVSSTLLTLFIVPYLYLRFAPRGSAVASDVVAPGPEPERLAPPRGTPA